MTDDSAPVATLTQKVTLTYAQVRALLAGQTLQTEPYRLTADQDRELRRLMVEVEQRTGSAQAPVVSAALPEPARPMGFRP